MYAAISVRAHQVSGSRYTLFDPIGLPLGLGFLLGRRTVRVPVAGRGMVKGVAYQGHARRFPFMNCGPHT